MNILNTLAPVGAPNGSAVALGYFDGVHLGHRRVLGAAVEYAAAHGLTPAAFTFSLPGGQSLKGGRILSAGQKHARVAALGITAYMEPPFESFRSLSPEDFVNKILVECFAAKAVFCGDNFTFGAYAAGNVDRLKELCAPLGIAVTIVDMAQYGGQTVSSTRIRAALEEGRIEDANAMLGAPYCIDWPVRHGKGIGTSKLGKPTINQNYPADALQPCTGVYLTRIWLMAAGGHPQPVLAAAPPWMPPTPLLPAKPMCRATMAIPMARRRCWNSTTTCALCASLVHCRSWQT